MIEIQGRFNTAICYTPELDPVAAGQIKLTYKEDDVYRCMKHIYNPEECPKTHAIYHEELYAYVLAQIKGAAKSMKRRKINSPIAAFAEIEELTPEVLNSVIERIEVGHITKKSRIGNVVRIQWKL